MKTHEFRLEVKTTDTRKAALFKLLSALKFTRPSSYKFKLKNLPPSANRGASIERAAIKKWARRMIAQNAKSDCYRPSFTIALQKLCQFINTRTARTAARNGGLGRK